MSVPGENIPVADAVRQARAGEDLRPWQTYLLSCFPESEFKPQPPFIETIDVSSWRLKTWEHLASDAVHCCGTQASVVLSMAYKPKVIVEMGIRDGTTTLLFCKLNPQARVWGVDSRSCMSDAAGMPVGYTAMMQGVDNLTLAVMPSWELAVPNVDLCFIDADHAGEAPYKDSRRAWENRNRDGDWCIAWDDYHENNPDVKRAVDRFVGEVQMPLWTINSWVYIGTKGPEAMEGLL